MSMLLNKWFNLLTSNSTPGENLKTLLRPYEIVIDKRIYERIDNLVLEYIETCYADPTTIEDPMAKDAESKYPYNEKNSPFSLDAKKLRSTANTMLNMTLLDAISEIWGQFGIKIETAKNGPAVRKIRLCRAVVKERLLKAIDEIIFEFEATLSNLHDLREGKFNPESEDTSAETEEESNSQE